MYDTNEDYERFIITSTVATIIERNYDESWNEICVLFGVDGVDEMKYYSNGVVKKEFDILNCDDIDVAKEEISNTYFLSESYEVTSYTFLSYRYIRDQSLK